ncbi:hypothetical protein [Aneurinibacillus danicus]|uniref:Uncharacterized protein n=1 Tax=Aneurinibacillus danicus TaxID=267746 RepID=A0A511V2I0_9BACL|nr:hypothetical protein [Aneurinibacillus danicus]GEN33115.1 hypothetical protein ADA01nite_05750 [Aneurinibacillus danicus]
MGFSEVLLLLLSMFALWWVLEFSTRCLIPSVRKHYYPSWLRYIWNIIILILVWSFAKTFGLWIVGGTAIIISFVLEKLFPAKPKNST